MDLARNEYGYSAQKTRENLYQSATDQNPITLEEKVVPAAEGAAAIATSAITHSRTSDALESLWRESLPSESFNADQARKDYGQFKQEYDSVAKTYEDLKYNYDRAVHGYRESYTTREPRMKYNYNTKRFEMGMETVTHYRDIPPNPKEQARLKPLLQAETQRILPQIQRHKETERKLIEAEDALKRAKKSLISKTNTSALAQGVRSKLSQVRWMRTLAHSLGLFGTVEAIQRGVLVFGNHPSHPGVSPLSRALAYEGEKAVDDISSKLSESYNKVMEGEDSSRKTEIAN